MVGKVRRLVGSAPKGALDKKKYGKGDKMTRQG
jgi:hypothetical protein